MKKYIIIAVIALTTILITSSVFISCERIDAGHEGILVNLYGSETGVNDVSYVYGYVFYNPFTQSVCEYPTYVQTTDYPAFEVYAKDGLLFTVEPTISLKVIDGQAAPIFRKYRKDLPDIINGPLFNQVRETFKSQISKLPANEIISNRDSLETAVREELAKALRKEGFQLEQLTFGLKYPERHCRCCQSR